MAPRTLDLFSGMGGLTVGLHRAGLHAIGGVDNWPDAARTFEHNLGLPCMQADLREVNASDICDYFGIISKDIDILVGGPPCQGFSTVGKRDSADPRNELWFRYLKLVSEIRPAYVVIENVEGLVAMERGSVCRKIVEAFAQIGYPMAWKLLTSANFGVPQLRKRVFFLGWLSGLKAAAFPAAKSSPWVTVGEAILDLPSLGPGESATQYDQEASTHYQMQRRVGTNVLSNHEAARHSPQLVEILRHVPDGGNRKSIPDELQPKSGFHNSYSRLASNKPSIAVTSNMRKPSSARATHPTQHRGLTVREGLRLQTFDDTFVVLGTRTSQYLQVGNAVPPLLAQAIGEQLVSAFASNSAKQLRRARNAAPSPVPPQDNEQLPLQITEF